MHLKPLAILIFFAILIFATIFCSLKTLTFIEPSLTNFFLTKPHIWVINDKV